MSDPFVAEIRMFAGNFAPRGWAFCNGQLLSIAQNTALFSLLGTTYGGNGQTTFALPDLQDRSPMHQGQGPGLTDHVMGESSGEATVTLLVSEMPAHTHQPQADVSGSGQTSPANAAWGAGGRGRPPAYATNSNPGAALSPQALALAGNNQPHNTRSPYLGVSFIIALQGIFPSRN
jgi:microcystin-dependent protein